MERAWHKCHFEHCCAVGIYFVLYERKKNVHFKDLADTRKCSQNKKECEKRERAKIEMKMKIQKSEEVVENIER